MYKWMWICSRSGGSYNQSVTVGFCEVLFALQRLVRTKTAHLEMKNFPEPLPACCISSVAFEWAIWLLLARLLQITLAGCHGITDPLRGRHQGIRVWALARFYLILYNFKWCITILTPKSREVIYWLMYPIWGHLEIISFIIWKQWERKISFWPIKVSNLQVLINLVFCKLCPCFLSGHSAKLLHTFLSLLEMSLRWLLCSVTSGTSKQVSYVWAIPMHFVQLLVKWRLKPVVIFV